MGIGKTSLHHILLLILIALLTVSCEKADEYVYLESTDLYGEWHAREINGQQVGWEELTFLFNGSGRCLINQKDTEQLGRWGFSEHDGERFIIITELDGEPDKSLTLQITWCSKGKMYLKVKRDDNGDEILLFK